MSLLPSATEIVYALGLGEDLVGVTFECDEPAAARAEKEVVVGGRDTSGMTPGEIDAYVRDQLARGGDLYTLHADALARLRPELILTQDLCRVCALPSGHVSAGARLSRLPGRRAVARPVHAGRGARHDRRGRRADGDAGPGRAAGRRAARAASPGGGGRRRAAAAPGGGRRVGGPAVRGRALDSRPGDRGGRRSRWPPARGSGRSSLTWADDRRRPARRGPRRPVRLPPGGRGRAGGARWPARWRPRCPACRCGRSTPTRSSSARGRDWSTGSRRSRRSCTRTRCPPRRRAIALVAGGARSVGKAHGAGKPQAGRRRDG